MCCPSLNLLFIFFKNLFLTYYQIAIKLSSKLKKSLPFVELCFGNEILYLPKGKSPYVKIVSIEYTKFNNLFNTMTRLALVSGSQQSHSLVSEQLSSPTFLYILSFSQPNHTYIFSNFLPMDGSLGQYN